MPVRWLRFITGAGLAVMLVVVSHFGLSWVGLAPTAEAQPALVLRRVEPVAIATQLHARYPDIPLENTYLRLSDGTPHPDSTLVSRLIRYHLFVKDRPANFRLDWKLTLADYLGAFQPIEPQFYPDQDELTESPMTGDMAAVARMSRNQRNQLVQGLVDVFTGQTPAP
ncbi:MAG: hypothetical protein AAFQ61_12425 [Cyanobacteria bacterium J06626_23]